MTAALDVTLRGVCTSILLGSNIVCILPYGHELLLQMDLFEKEDQVKVRYRTSLDLVVFVSEINL